MGDVTRATEAIINLIEPIVNLNDQASADKVYATLTAVMNYPDVDFSDKLLVIHGVARFLIRNCGVDSPMTEAALKISIENNNMLN
jgi:hypothetical protein